jgi:dTDP-4-amino-4,6-dideoxygalactose transaminase
MVRMADLPKLNRRLRSEIEPVVLDVIENARFDLGEEVSQFEQAFTQKCGGKFAVAVKSGSSALFLALRASGIGPGDEVITVANAEISACGSISHCGATPVFVDIEDRTYNLDPLLLERAIGPKTTAVLPVHLYGCPADIAAIQSIAQEHSLKVIWDACLAVGATYRGQPVTSFGDAACYSFGPYKHLGAFGGAGMVVTNSAETAQRLRLLRGYGEDSPSGGGATRGFRAGPTHFVEEGYNLKIDTLQAAVLRVKLAHLEEFLEARRRLADVYRRELGSCASVVVPYEPPDVRHAYRNFVVRVPHRDEVRRMLLERGIQTGLHYAPPVHLDPVYTRRGWGPGDLPVTERVAQSLLSLPIHTELTCEEATFVADQLRQVLASKG